MQESKKKKRKSNPQNCPEVMSQKNMPDHNIIVFVSVQLWSKFMYLVGYLIKPEITE